MRKKLEKLIRKKVGHTYGSLDIKILRQDLICGALERYDDEIASGASPEEAYRTAAASVGDLKELLKSTGITDKRKRIGLYISIPLLALLLVPVIICVIALKVVPFWQAVATVVGILTVGLIAFGVISLILGFRIKPLSIVSIVIGAQIYMYVAFIAFYTTAAASSTSGTETRFDYTGDMDIISSISVIELDSGYGSETDEDDLEYHVLKEVDEADWEPLLKAVSELEYVRPFGDPPSAVKGEQMIMIRFDPSKDGVTMVLIGQRCPAHGERYGSGVRLIFDNIWCGSNDWDEKVAGYLN